MMNELVVESANNAKPIKKNILSKKIKYLLIPLTYYHFVRN